MYPVEELKAEAIVGIAVVVMVVSRAERKTEKFSIARIVNNWILARWGTISPTSRSSLSLADGVGEGGRASALAFVLGGRGESSWPPWVDGVVAGIDSIAMWSMMVREDAMVLRVVWKIYLRLGRVAPNENFPGGGRVVIKQREVMHSVGIQKS